MLSEIVFEVTQEEDGGYSAKAVGESIFTQGDTWDDLREMARDAVKCHFGEADFTATIRLQHETASQAYRGV
jgi:predicted RNase H-like HicB family nuclease